MAKLDLTGALYSALVPEFAERRRLLQRLVSERNRFSKYDRAFAKGIKETQRMANGLIFGTAVVGAGMLMVYTRFFRLNGFPQGIAKVLLFWSTSWVLSDIAQVEGVLKRNRERVKEMTEKYSLASDA